MSKRRERDCHGRVLCFYLVPIPPPAFSQAPAPAPAADPVPATAPDHVSTPVPVLVPVNDHVFVLNLGVTGEVYAMTREALLNLGWQIWDP